MLCFAGEQKTAIPDESAQKESLEIVREVYGELFKKARTDEAKSELAKDLVQEGINSSRDAAACFVLLKVAKDIAEQAHDVETAFGAIDEISMRFDVDGLKLKCDSIASASTVLRSTKDHKDLSAFFDSLLTTVAAESRYDLAERLTQAALNSARRTKDRSRIDKIVLTSRDIESARKAHVAAKDALATLKQDPTDPAANRVAGEFSCLMQGDWEIGLPMLALSDNPKLQKPAQQELGNPTEGLAQMQLADDWYALASEYRGGQRHQLLAHAAQWYGKAETNVKGLVKIKVTKRLREIDNLTAAATIKTKAKRPTKIEKPLLVHLPLNKDLRDISGNNIHGTAIGDLKLQPPGYVLFDGSRDFIRLPYIPLSGKSFAICFWVRLDKTEDRNGFLVQRGSGGSNNMLHLETRNNRCPRMGFYQNDVDTTTPLRPPGQWQHLVFQYGSEKQQVWLDGKLIGEKTAVAYAGKSGDTLIGQSPFSRNLSGGMLDFRIYGAELTADEITVLHKLLASKLQPPTSKKR
jgi:hypothetical protein